jgi:AcrR family transcriptional regulator
MTRRPLNGGLAEDVTRLRHTASAPAILQPPAETEKSGPGRPRRAPSDGDLRERILDAAEEQFAKLGYEAVTTRAVAQAAGATAAMIHYYFSTKRRLFDAVFARRAEVVNAERMAAFDDYLRAVGDDVTVEGAIAAFLSPVFARLASAEPGWRNYLNLVAQVGNKHEWGGEVMTRSFDPVIERLIGIIRRALPGAKDVELYWAYHFLSGALLLTLSETDRIDRLSNGQCRSTDIAAIEPRLVAFAAAGFRKVCA